MLLKLKMEAEIEASSEELEAELTKFLAQVNGSAPPPTAAPKPSPARKSKKKKSEEAKGDKALAESAAAASKKEAPAKEPDVPDAPEKTLQQMTAIIAKFCVANGKTQSDVDAQKEKVRAAFQKHQADVGGLKDLKPEFYTPVLIELGLNDD